ncbi:hypothetical protein AgCh_024652 [Apium graveolens]
MALSTPIQIQCTDFKWIWDGVKFSKPVQVVSMDKWQIILGGDWLSDVHFNYSDQTLQFHWKGSPMLLTETKTEVSTCAQLTTIITKWMEQIGNSYEGDTKMSQLIIGIQALVIFYGARL